MLYSSTVRLQAVLSKRYSTTMLFTLYLPRGMAAALSKTLSFILGAVFQSPPAQHTRTNLYSRQTICSYTRTTLASYNSYKYTLTPFLFHQLSFLRPHLARSDFISLRHTRCDHRSRSKDNYAGKSCATCGVRLDAELSRTTRQSQHYAGYRKSLPKIQDIE